MDLQRAWVRHVAPLALAAACHTAVLVAVPAPAFAQGGGKTTVSLIQRGGDLFDDQQYEESIQTLSAALMRPGTSVAEKTEIYRLLAYNYITLKRFEEADAAVRGLYVIDEKYTLPTTESPRFRDFFDATRKKWEEEGKPGKVDETRATKVDKPVRITHTSPAQVEPDVAVKLSGSLDDPDGRVRSVQLAYRTGAKGKFVTVTGTYVSGQFRAQIPAAAVKPPLVEYYLQATDKGGLPIASRGDAATPLRIAVPEPKGGVLSSPWFWVPVGVLVVGGAVATTLFLTRGATPSSGTSTVTIRVTE